MPEIHTYLEALMLTDDQPLQFQAGQALFEQGDPADGRMYVVRTGSVELRLGGRLLETVGPGGMVGEMALIDPAPRSARALAVADCAVTAVNRTTFLELVKRVPGLAIEVMRIMAGRLRRATAQAGAASARSRSKPGARKPAKPRAKAPTRGAKSSGKRSPTKRR
jgi:CRP-like cAMP-binding protein